MRANLNNNKSHPRLDRSAHTCFPRLQTCKPAQSQILCWARKKPQKTSLLASPSPSSVYLHGNDFVLLIRKPRSGEIHREFFFTLLFSFWWVKTSVFDINFCPIRIPMGRGYPLELEENKRMSIRNHIWERITGSLFSLIDFDICDQKNPQSD